MSLVEEEGTPGILDGISEKISAALVEAGLDNHEAIIAASDKDLIKIPGLGPKTVEKLRELAEKIKEAGEE